MTLALKTRKDAATLLALKLVQGWVRDRFALPEDATVMANEVACPEPMCPLETIIAFWEETGERRQYKILKAARDVTRDDVFRLGAPPADLVWCADGCC